MDYGKYEDLTKRTQSSKVLKDIAFEIASNLEYAGYQRGLASVVFNFFDKMLKSSGIKSMSNQELAEELHKPIIKKFKKRKVYSYLKDNIWGVDLADMQLISKYNKRIRYFLCVIDILIKCTWVVPLKDKRGVTIVNAFQIENQIKYGLIRVVNFKTVF